MKTPDLRHQCLVAMLAALIAAPCWADSTPTWWLQVGATDDHHGPWVAATIASASWDGTSFGAWRFSPQVLLGWIARRGGDARYETTYVPYAGAGVQVAHTDWPISLAFSPVLNARTNQYIGGHLNFLTELSYHYGHATFSLAHISNADLTSPNRGENLILVGWDF